MKNYVSLVMMIVSGAAWFTFSLYIMYLWVQSPHLSQMEIFMKVIGYL